MISRSTITEVNNRLDAIEIVGDYVRLEKRGTRWIGSCPFHRDGQQKTPSFNVEPDKKLYHCFGCQKGGSIINFFMEMENLTFVQAIKTLAKKMGIEIQYDGNTESEQDNSIKDQLYELYSRVTGTFQYFLNEKPEGKNALNYIIGRGFNPEIIEKFKLGYAPAARDFLHKFLKQKGYSDEFLAKSGLFSANYKTIPLFSGRLIFPITDRQGKIVAFGGRSLPGQLQNDGKEPPKYINSPETEIYKKRETLFAFDLAKPVIRQSKTVYLAEGYIDVMALHQAGITNAVAPLGTAFTEEQAIWMKRWVEKLILFFDSDEAGVKAAYNTIIICRKNGMFCSLVDVENGLKNEVNTEKTDKIKDPGEIYEKFGEKILKNILKFIINDFEYLISRAKSQFIEKEGNIFNAVRFMFPFLESLSSEIENSDCITRIADIFKIGREAVQNDFSEWKKRSGGFSRSTEEKLNSTGKELISGKQSSQSQEGRQKLTRQKLTRNAELGLLTIVAVNMEIYKNFRAAVEIKEIEDKAAKEIFVALEECFIHDENGIDSVLSRIKNEELRNFVADRGTSGEYKGDFACQLMEDGIQRLKIKRFEKRLTEINAQMREIERKNEASDSIDELLEEKKQIDMQIRNLKIK